MKMVLNPETLRIICIFCALFLLAIAIPLAIKSNVKKKMKQLAENTIEITPQDFFRIRNTSLGGRGRKHVSGQFDFTGVYILLNKSKNMYYVGQSKNVFQRVNQHFTGHGNGDVYADYKNGDQFTIKMISLENSGCSTLNELERYYIQVYKAHSKGYNKTRGNRG